MPETQAEYTEIEHSQIPYGVRFDVPRRHQGQHIEVAYGGYGAYEHCAGSEYKRVTDRSVSPAAVSHYRMADA